MGQRAACAPRNGAGGSRRARETPQKGGGPRPPRLRPDGERLIVAASERRVARYTERALAQYKMLMSFRRS